MFDRSSGILMHVSSLPGKFGIGTFGAEARKFADFLNKAGFKYWQVLPFGPTADYNSPYQCYSAFAGNYFFIDPELLEEDGLISQKELEECVYRGSRYETDFNWQKTVKLNILKKAYMNLSHKLKEKIDVFVGEESYWLPDYALYTALKNKYGQKAWWEWPEELRRFEKDAVEKAAEELKDDIYFEYFCQYIFFKQWYDLKKYVNDLGIKFIGDMPIYVSGDSADIWSKSQFFEMDKDHSLKSVAGVPPDYFSEDGQLWGNPLYDWEAMKEDGYSWWIKRVGHSLKMFDSMRIDHFRGFVAYWSVPANSDSAKNGKWITGPGAGLFDVIKKNFKDASIIAEDLGDITDDVRKFVEYTGFPGMRVMQFAFLDDNNNTHLPHNYTANSVAYTGTHDNNTVLGWLWEATPEQRDRALFYCGFSGEDWGAGGPASKACRSWVRTLLASHANLAIMPIQDLCGFGGDTRMNKPGVAEGNWTFRISQEALDGIDVKEIRRMNYAYRRI